MDGDVTERDNITPLHLRVRITKSVRNTRCRFTNHGELLKSCGLMQFADEKLRGIQIGQKCLNQVAGLKDVFQIEELNDTLKKLTPRSNGLRQGFGQSRATGNLRLFTLRDRVSSYQVFF